MSEQDLVVKCSADVLVNYVESLHVYTGLLTVATVCGGLSGILAAALLYVFCLKTLIFTRQGDNARRLLESHDGEVENNTSDHASNDRKEAPPATANDKEKKQEPTNNDVAAFASRAKVVYPINQKYRPLADGASNPSLHECSKLPTMPKDDSSSSFTEGESLSQELDNDDGSQFISSSSVPKNLQNQSFVRVSHYSYTLTQTGFEARINLHCLALKDVQQLCSQLLEEKYLIYLQMVKKIFCSHFPRDKKDAEFTKRLFQMQQKEVEELKKQLPTGHAVSDDSVDAPCTLEEMERSQKDFLEGSLQMSKRFSKMVEELCQHVMKRTSSFTVDEAHDCTLALNQTLVLVENHLMKAQEAQIMQIHQKLLWWEELTGLLQSQPALVQQEASLRQDLMATALEQLNGENVLTFSCMETILSQVQHAHAEGLRQCREDFMRRTKELLVEKCNKMEAKRKKLWTSQDKERSRLLELRQTHGDPEQLSKEYQEILLKQRQKLCDLELQQDDRMAESLCNVWTKLRSTWTEMLEERAKDIFCMSVTTQCKLSHERCQALWLDVEQQFAAQQEQVERTTGLQMDQIQAQIEQDRQVWTESLALMHASLKDLKNQQMEILRAMVVSQSYTLNSHVGKLLDKKHEHLLASVQRHFMARHFCLHLLKEMRLSKLKVLSQRDFRALLMQDPAAIPSCVDSALKESSASLAEKHLDPESQLVSHSFHQEFLSELETGTEILKNHSQLLLGNALSFAVLQLMEGRLSESQSCSRHDDASKHHLTEAASESVYVTKDSLTALVQTYYSNLQDIAQKLRPHQSNTNHVTEEDSSGSQLNKALLRELDNWGRKPASAKFQQRVEFHKRKMLEQCNLEQEKKCEDLRRRKVAQDQNFERINDRLQKAERSFMSDLAALARVSLHSPDAEDSDEDDNAGKSMFSGEGITSIMDLLARNPALDPALNPSLTPTVVTPATSKPTKKKKRQQEALNS
ncbi:ellis-van Creveld syndrome protein isoform X2 [Hippocampus comes]|uniref:ellis-van Creveld syndrome protein isoform X2 n=1 Tax=Hippocampus comes TaxID=109280 RepID=UPI00094E8E52|nr:PREDICTED: ellis-van Creveld syndrome protein isoform X2 [Hippocampus comes]